MQQQDSVQQQATTQRQDITQKQATTPTASPLRRVLTGLAVLLGLYLAWRASVEPFLVDYDDPSSYENAWGGPTVVGVLAVHMLPGIISAVLLLVWWIRRRR